MSDRPLKTLKEIRDMATEMAGLAEALELLMDNVEESAGYRLVTFAVASLVKEQSDAINRALDDYTTRNPW